MSMAPSVESSSFSQYSSNPTPPATAQPGVGTGGWFKEHALFILMGVIALVAVLWFIARRSSSSTGSLSADNGYPLGYPSVGAGTSGGSGASSGSSGSGDTGTGATASDQALKDFMEGFALRDGQIQPQGASTSTTNTTTTNNYYTTPDPIAPNIVTPPTITQPVVGATTTTQQAQTSTATSQTRSLQTSPQGTTTQALNLARAGITASAIQQAATAGIQAVYGSNYQAVSSTGTHVATGSSQTSNNNKNKGKGKTTSHVRGGSSQSRREY